MKIYAPAVTVAAVFFSLSFPTDSNAFFRGKDIQSPHHLPAGFIRFALESNDGMGVIHCSATKIRPHVFLTAAHCLRELEVGDDIRIFSHEDLALKYDESVKSLVEAHNTKMHALQERYNNGELTYDVALAQSKIYEAELDQKGGRHLTQWNASAQNPVTHVFKNPKHRQARVTELMKTDVGIFITKYDPKYVTTANIDLDHVVSSSNSYLMIGHDRTSEDYSRNYKYEITNKFKTSLSRKNSVYVFGTPPGKGRVTQGDSGGGLYRFNRRTGKYDTVVGVTSAITKALFIHLESSYAPLHRSFKAGNGPWIEQTLRKIDALNISSSGSFFE